MGTSTSKARTPATRHASLHTAALPPTYQLAIEDLEFQMTILDDQVPRIYDADCAVMPSTWFSVAPTAPTDKRYLYLVQQEADTGLVVMLMLLDRGASRDTQVTMLPAGGAWQRAVVDGTVYVLASNLMLSRKSITAWIGGREPTTPAQPPYT